MGQLMIPSPEVLANLVSTVTSTMFDIRFHLAEGVDALLPWEDPQTWPVLFIPLGSANPTRVAIASDEPGSKRLAASMFSCKTEEVDNTMMHDAMGELLNIIAGQVKLCMGLEEDMGLPTTLQIPSSVDQADESVWRVAWLHGHDCDVKVWVAIAEPV